MTSRVPPLPQFSVMEDRDDGTLWTLSHAEQEGTTYISINSEGTRRGPVRFWLDVINYEADDGIDMGQGIRLFVRGGRLGYEMVDSEIHETTPYTRRGVARETYQLTIPAGWVQFDDRLGFDDESVL